MTGFGEARRQQDGLAVAVEVRAINSRYFKLTVRSAESYNVLEPQIEAVVRQHALDGAPDDLFRTALEQVHWTTNRKGDWSEMRAFAFDHREQFEARCCAPHLTLQARVQPLFLVFARQQKRR